MWVLETLSMPKGLPLISSISLSIFLALICFSLINAYAVTLTVNLVSHNSIHLDHQNHPQCYNKNSLN